MLNKDIELLEGLVLVWGNDYLKTKKEESKTKYIDNFTKLINIYGQIYLEEINKLKDTNNNIVEEEKRLIKLKELKEKRIAQKEKMSISYKNITSEDYIFESKTDEPDLDSIRNRLEVIQKYLNNTNLKCIIGEFKGIEFEVFNDSTVDDVFNDYYSKYDEAYGISQMLSDLDLLK